jgi:hypothetical protein
MSTKNPALIRFVASRYRELQGLRTVGDAGFLLLNAAGFWFIMWTERESSAFVLGAVLSAYIWRYFWRLGPQLDRYYATRFGRVGPQFNYWPVFLWMMQGPMAAPILSDMGAPATIAKTLVLILIAARPAWIAIRDFPFRAHWLVVAIVGILHAAQLPPTRPAIFAWEMRVFFAVGLAWAFAGLCDHVILVRTLRPGAAAASEEAIPDQDARRV